MPPPTEVQIAARQAWVVDALDRRMHIIEGLVAKSHGPLDWLGVRRLARRFIGYASPLPPTRPRPESLQAAFDDHVARLEALAAQAEGELAEVDADALAEARSRLGLRLALIGKGGAGKTVLSSTLARTLAQRGRKVFACDLDTCPGLAFSLGIEVTDAGLPDEAIEENALAPYGWQLAAGVTPDEAVERFGAVAPNGIRFLGLGKIGAVDKDTARRSVAAVRQNPHGLRRPRHRRDRRPRGRSDDAVRELPRVRRGRGGRHRSGVAVGDDRPPAPADGGRPPADDRGQPLP